MLRAKRGDADLGAQSEEGARTSVKAPDLHLLVQPSRRCVGSAKPPCRPFGTGRFNVKLSSCPETYSNEFLSTMSERIKDDVEIMATLARRLVTDEEGEAQRSRRHFARQLVCLEKSLMLGRGVRSTYE